MAVSSQYLPLFNRYVLVSTSAMCRFSSLGQSSSHFVIAMSDDLHIFIISLVKPTENNSFVRTASQLPFNVGRHIHGNCPSA